jgi:hypothetical protein
MIKRLLATLGLALGATLCTVPASAAITVTFNPTTTHLNNIGDSVSVDVNIAGLGAEILSAFDLDLLFNGTVLSNFAVVHQAVPHFGGLGDSYFGTTFDPGRTENIDGSLLLDADLLGQADAFTILTFNFQALADGVSQLAFGPDLDFERNFVGLDALSLVVDIGTACISVGTGVCVNQVPEPGSLALVGLALVGAFMGRRRVRDVLA